MTADGWSMREVSDSRKPPLAVHPDGASALPNRLWCLLTASPFARTEPLWASRLGFARAPRPSHVFFARHPVVLPVYRRASSTLNGCESYVRDSTRHPGCHACDSDSFAHGPVTTTCSMVRFSYRSLVPHVSVHALMTWQRFHRVTTALWTRLAGGTTVGVPDCPQAERDWCAGLSSDGEGVLDCLRYPDRQLRSVPVS